MTKQDRFLREFVASIVIVLSYTDMIYDPATAPYLKPWLVRTLEPVYVHPFSSFTHIYTHIALLSRCDAEPGALADYILALLKHNVSEPEMRKELLVQLDEFLEKGAFFKRCKNWLVSSP